MPASRRSPGFVKTIYPRTLLLFEQSFDWRITGRWMLYSVLVGIAVAVAAFVFNSMVSAVSSWALVDLVGYKNPIPAGEVVHPVPFDLNDVLNPARRWLLFIVPAMGGLLAGVLVFALAPEAEGHGTDAVIRAFHRERGIVSSRIPLVKMAASALTIGSGGSAGREGPIAQIGAALASIIGQRFHLSDRERRMLMIGGVAAGIGTIFKSPLGGAFFAVEVLYREDIESEALMPAVVTSITGYSLYSVLEGSGSVFLTPHFQFVSPLELVPLLPFALFCAVAGILFVKIFYGTKKNVFDRLRIPRYIKPALGGLLVGIIAYFFPPVLGSSYGWLQQAIDGRLPLALMATLAFLKMISTSLTTQSGGSGGVFAPSLVIGGMLGGVFGSGLHTLAPSLVTQPQAYVMIGMAAFFTAVGNVPVSTTIMISELTGSYTLLVPLIFTGVLVHLATKKWSLYGEQVRTHEDSPAHRMDLTPDLLETIHLETIVDHPIYYHVLHPSNTLQEMLDVFTRTREVILPVSNESGTSETNPDAYSGLVLLDDVQSFLKSGDSLSRLIVAHDVAVPFRSVRLDDSLKTALDVFLSTEYPELPVTGPDGTIAGFIRQSQVINEYYRAYLRKQNENQ